MPTRTKLQRSGKLAGLRRVYVSLFDPMPYHKDWIDAFWAQVKADTDQLADQFAESLRTGDIEAGELINDWFDRKKNKEPITDVVGLLTANYIAANADGRDGTPSNGELARAFDTVLRHDADDRLRVFLAPVDPPQWTRYKVRKIVLGDPERAHADWLRRLRDERFPWPEPGRASEAVDAIARAVNDIVDRIDE